MGLKNDSDDFWGLIISFTILGAVLLALFIVPIVALCAIPGIAAYYVYTKYRDDPSRLAGETSKHNALYFEQVKQGTLAQYSQDDLRRMLNRHLRGSLPADVERHFLDIGFKLVKMLDLGTEIPPPPAVASAIESARYRDKLAKIGTRSPEYVKKAVDHIAQILGYASRQYTGKYDTGTKVPARYFMKDLPQVVQDMCEEIVAEDYFKPLADILQENLQAVKAVQPVDYDGREPVEAVYFAHTPLRHLFDWDVPFEIPDSLRTFHHHILATVGSGKSALIRDMVMKDAEDGCAVIVIDSQVDLINDIARVVDHDRIVLIDPTDVEYPLAINLLDIAQGEIQSPMERQASINNLHEMFAYIFGSLLDTEMTAKQKTAFQYVTKLLLSVPGATFDDLRKLFLPYGTTDYKDHIDAAGDVVKSFFNHEFDTSNFRETRDQVRGKLATLSNNDILYAIFRAKETKLNLFNAIEEGKVILVNSAKGVLGREGSILFSRFIVAMVRQACFDRQFKGSRRRTYLYLDEAHEYLDGSTTEMLEQARKYNLGLILAHQALYQLKEREAAIHAVTNIKMVGYLKSKDDIRVMADTMHIDRERMYSLPDHTFMAHFARLGTFPYSIDINRFNKADKASDWAMGELRNRMREEYSQGKVEIGKGGMIKTVTPPPDLTEKPITPPEDEEWVGVGS